MMCRGTVRLCLVAGVLSAACSAQSAPASKPADAPCSTAKPASGQSSSQTNAPAASKPCAAPAAPKSTAEQFPFPGESDQPEAPAATTPAPNAPAPSAASQHPFPGEPPAADSGSSSSSSSSDAGGSSSSSSDDDGYNPNAPLPSTLKKPPSPFTKVQTADQRVDEDLRVANFYMDNDNLAGAYLRAKDAVKTEPDYSETHFTLAQVLQMMKKKDEAIAEYKAYLKMDPNGDRVKAVNRALDELDRGRK